MIFFLCMSVACISVLMDSSMLVFSSAGVLIMDLAYTQRLW